MPQAACTAPTAEKTRVLSCWRSIWSEFRDSRRAFGAASRAQQCAHSAPVRSTFQLLRRCRPDKQPKRPALKATAYAAPPLAEPSPLQEALDATSPVTELVEPPQIANFSVYEDDDDTETLRAVAAVAGDGLSLRRSREEITAGKDEHGLVCERSVEIGAEV